MTVRLGLSSLNEQVPLRRHLPDPAVALKKRPSWESAWSFADLRSASSWQFAAVTAAGSKTDLALKDIAAITRPPKPKPLPSAVPGGLRPLIGRRSFSNVPELKPQEWVSADGAITTSDNSILVRATGVPRAGIAPKGHLLTDDVLLIELHETGELTPREAAVRLAFYLNSPAGQRELDAQSAGIALRRLRPETLAEVRVPGWSRMEQGDPETRPLAARLDEVLFREQK